jgi:TonB family protein
VNGWCIALAILIELLTVTPSAQEALQTAKALYASAAYEEALAVLARVPRSEALSEVEQYRAFCLIALGRLDEAQHAVESVVASTPKYVPGDLEVSPRIQEVFAETRKQLLPAIARRAYVDARRALERKEWEAAMAGFAEVVDLVDVAGPDAGAGLEELRFLAAEFLDLGRTLGEQASEPSSGVGAPVAPSAPTEAQPAITPAVPVRQPLPSWAPSSASDRQKEFAGAIRVSISAEGRVERAEIIRSVHPIYDRQLLQAARDWEYLPALRGGIPFPSDRVIEVQLKPNQ